MTGVDAPTTGKELPRFTVFIPTFNRAGTLRRALDSISAQSFRDFEVVIVDDGSTDETAEVVEHWQRGQALSVDYIYQTNRGKHAAHNTAIEHARGELTIILDSDDALLPEALSRLDAAWSAIPPGGQGSFAGVEGLAVDLNTGDVLGKRFPADTLDATFHDMRHVHDVTGDKLSVVRTDVLRAHPYPVFGGERHIRPSLLWERLSCRRYLFRYINIPVLQKEYQSGGLSSDRFRLRVNNPQGFALYYRECADQFHREHGLAPRLALMANYVRYSLHAGIGPVTQLRAVRSRGIWLAALPRGFLARQIDKIRERGRRR